jgi:hypothetical protein
MMPIAQEETSFATLFFAQLDGPIHKRFAILVVDQAV